MSGKLLKEKFLIFLKEKPLYVFLLPAFFLLHSVREIFYFIEWDYVLPLFAWYYISLIIVFSFFWLIFRQVNKAALITFLLFGIFFFLSVVRDFLLVHLRLMGSYSVLFLIVGLSIAVLIVYLNRKKRDFKKVHLFLNLLFLLYVFYDSSIVLYKLVYPPKNKYSTESFVKKLNIKIPDSCTKPDIYFLIFDEYASTNSLKNDFGYNNNRLDSFLVSKGFNIQKSSSSNYCYTFVSIASILNMNYIEGMNINELPFDDRFYFCDLIEKNELVNFLSENGYEIINNSIFDIINNPSPRLAPGDFLLNKMKRELVSYRTLWWRLKRDIFKNFGMRRRFKWLYGNAIDSEAYCNNKLIELVKRESLIKVQKPRFIYAHFTMPHLPYYFDKGGNLRNDKDALTDISKAGYLEYIEYTNNKIYNLINNILINNNGQAVIVFMGDHGYRENFLSKPAFYHNQNAVYLPNKNYKNLYDSISGVNQFRVLINTLFNQQIPLLKDSSVFLNLKF